MENLGISLQDSVKALPCHFLSIRAPIAPMVGEIGKKKYK